MKAGEISEDDSCGRQDAEDGTGRSHKPRLGFTKRNPPSLHLPSPVIPLAGPICRHVGPATLLPLLDSISRLIKDRWSERTSSRSFQRGGGRERAGGRGGKGGEVECTRPSRGRRNGRRLESVSRDTEPDNDVFRRLR